MDAVFRAAKSVNVRKLTRGFAMIDQRLLLTVQDVAEALHVARSTVYKLIQSGEFPKPIKLGKKSIRWRPSAVESYITKLEREQFGETETQAKDAA